MSLLDAVRADARFSQLDGSSINFGRQAVVVIDTGIDLDHPEFAGRVTYSYDFTGSNDPDATDSGYHGTHVAGIVGSTGYGVAPDVDIIALKVFPSGSGASSTDITEALNWVVANADAYNVVAVNLSLGSRNNSDGYLNSSYNTQFKALVEDKRVAVVVAGGNEFQNVNVPGVSSPSADPYAICVGALNSSETGFAHFSQRQPTVMDIVAPGESIYSPIPNNTYSYLSGTSMASPFIAGLCALGQQLTQDLTTYYSQSYHLAPAALEDWLELTSDIFFDVATQASYRKVNPYAFLDYIYKYWTDGTDQDQTLDGVEGDDDIDAKGGADHITGDYGNDKLNGGDGNDIVEGEWGNDTVFGGLGADQISGGLGDDFLYVDNAADVVAEAVGEGTDQVLVPVSYVLTAGAEIEQISVVDTNSTTAVDLTGNEFSQRINGNAGNNTLDGGDGNDQLYGGAGYDLYIVDSADDLITEDVGNGTDTVNASASVTLEAEVENLLLLGTAGLSGNGNALANQITGNVANNTLSGLAGDDRLNGASGNDVVYGGDGNDTLQGEAGNDTLEGEAGNDRLDVGTGLDRIYGGDGDDTAIFNGAETGDVVDGGIGYDTLWVYGTAGNDVMAASGTGASVSGVAVGTNIEKLQFYGNDGNDTLTGGAAAEFFYGGNGNDILDGGTGTDQLEGGTGDDTYVLAVAGDRIVEVTGAGTDTVNSAATATLALNVENLVLTGTAAINGTGNALANRITGNGAANLLSGADGTDTLLGGAGNDTLEGGAGNDRLEGGTGDDTYTLTTNGDTIVEAATSGTDQVNAALTWTLGAEVENLTLTGTYAINGTGNTLANRLTGNGSNNTLYGLAGNDTLDGGTGGTDRLEGGTGDDTYVLAVAGDAVVEAASAGTDTVNSAATATLAANVENLVLTGTAAINGTGNAGINRITGNTANNVLSGLDGTDTLVGGAGNDTLDGGTGTDRLEGGAGDDTYVLAVAGDTIVELAGGGSDTLNAGATMTLMAEVENLVLTGTTAINGTGTAGNNRLTGNGANNTLYGLDGNDTLLGGAGNDTLEGGTGTDRVEGGTGDDTYILAVAGDTIVEAAGAGTDTVNVGASLTLAANVENLVLTGTTAINGTGNTLANRITGNGANNTLTGAVGTDTLLGGSGNDTLVGGAGIDQLTGGLGDDAFLFNSASEGGDVVSDFRNLTGDNDLFRISAGGFGGGLTAGALSGARFQLRGDNLAQDTDDRFIFRTTDKSLWFDINGNVSGGLTMLADLDASATMASSDIFLV